MPGEIDRRTYLLREIARVLDQGVNPFTLQWMDEHKAAHEMKELMDNIAAILVGYLAASKEVQLAVIKAYGSPAALEVLTN